MGVRKGNEGEKVMNGLLAHPFSRENGLLSTLSGKGWTKRPFSGGSSPQCEALKAFSTPLCYFGGFGVQTPKSIESRNLLSPTGMGP